MTALDPEVPRESGFAYVIMAHTDPQRVLATARRVRQLSPGARLLVRHAQGSRFLPTAELAAAGAEELHSRVRVRWGDFSLVAAVLEALAEAERRFHPCATVVVSGQDHPVRDLARWEEGFLAAGTDALLRPDPRSYPDRHERCWHSLPTLQALPLPWRRMVRLTEEVAGRVGGPCLHLAGGSTLVLEHARCGLAPRAPQGLRYHKGSLWTTLSARAVTRLLDAGEGPAVRRFFATTLLPDEAFTHTVLRAAPDLRITDGPTSLPFFPPQGAAHPRTVVLGDLEAVRASGAPFTRKVVSPDSDAFVRAVDALVDAGRSAANAGPAPGGAAHGGPSDR